MVELADAGLSRGGSFGVSSAVPAFSCRDIASGILSAHFESLDHEQLHAYFLDALGQCRHGYYVSQGHTDAVNFCIRTILRQALVSEAVGIVVAHNHPSGDPSPSEQDIQATKAIFSACRLVGLQLEDHLIFGSGQYFSFRDKGLL